MPRKIALDLFNAQDNIKNIKTIFVPANCAILQWQSYPNQVHLKGFSESEYQKLLKLLFVGISSYDLRLLSKWLLQRAGKNLKYARAVVRSLTEKGHIVSKGNIWHIKWDKILKEPDLPEEIIKDLEIWWQLLSPNERKQAIEISMGCLTKDCLVGSNLSQKLKVQDNLLIISENLTLGFIFGRWDKINIAEFIKLLAKPDFVWPDFYYCPEVSNLMAKIELWDQWLILTAELLKKAEDEKNIENSIFFAERLLNSGKLSKQNYDRLATMATDIYCQFRQWESALQLWSNMEKELGSTWKYWRKMFYILINAKRYDRASQTISEIINRKQHVTKDIKVLAAIFDGYIKGIGGDFESGRSRIDDCLEQGKAMADSNIIMAGYEMLAMLFYYKSDWNQAIRCFEQAYKYVSKDAEVYELVRMHAAYGMALWRTSSYDKAKEAILQGVDMLDRDTPNQGLAKMFYALGLLYFDMKKWKYAEECFENCIYHSLGIRDVITLTAAKGGLANVAMKQGRFKWARQIYQELLADNQIRNDIGGQIGCYSNLGILENLLGNKIQAKEYVVLAVEENKKNQRRLQSGRHSLRLKAGIELEQREWGQALQSYFECLKYYSSKSMPADPDVYIELTYAEYKRGNIDEARKFLEKARGTLNQSTMVASRIKGIEGIIMMMEERQRQEGVKKAIEAGEEMINDGDIFYAANCWLRTGEEAVGTGDAVAIKEVMPWLLKAESEFMQMGTPEHLERARETIVKAARVLFQHTRKTVSSDLLNGLYTLAELLSLEGDQKTIAQSALNLAVEMSGAERGALFLLDEKSKIELAAQIDIDDQTYQDAMEFSASAVLSTADSGNAIISNDASVDEAFKSRLSVQRNIIRSLLCAPIRFREGAVGAIYLDSRVTTGLFGHEEKDFVLALSGIIGAVLESKKLMNKLKEKGLGALNKSDEFSSSIIGQSSIMQAMVERIKAIAKADINVLLDGESGSGKEVVAQVIHEFSPRRS